MASDEYPLPDVGGILARLRKRHGMSLRDLAQTTGLSASFLSAVERGQSDIALGRLARVAGVFDHDIGSFLGFSGRRGRPHVVSGENQFQVTRGPGIEYRVSRIPDLGYEVVHVKLEPHCRFDDALRHEGVDITLVTSGEVVLEYGSEEYSITNGQCVVISGAYAHLYRNDTDSTAELVSLVTEEVY